MNAERDRQEAHTLAILDVIDRQNDVSQRNLAKHLGVALGLTNSYLKRCVRKGLIKVSQAPANRYLYYLTPKGFAEKSRLTARYLTISFSFYRRAGDSCQLEFERCKRNGWHKVLLCGLSDLAEIATVRAMEHDIAIIGYHDPASDRERFLSRPVWRNLGEAEVHDVCMLTDLKSPQESYQQLQKLVGSDRILVPDVLRLGNGSL